MICYVMCKKYVSTTPEVVVDFSKYFDFVQQKAT